MYKNKKISLVIPARNEEKLIRPTLERVPELIDKIYVIDDGSTDDTVSVVEERRKADNRIELIKNEKNIGPGGSIIKGYLESSRFDMDIAQRARKIMERNEKLRKQ